VRGGRNSDQFTICCNHFQICTHFVALPSKPLKKSKSTSNRGGTLKVTLGSLRGTREAAEPENPARAAPIRVTSAVTGPSMSWSSRRAASGGPCRTVARVMITARACGPGPAARRRLFAAARSGGFRAHQSNETTLIGDDFRFAFQSRSAMRRLVRLSLTVYNLWHGGPGDVGTVCWVMLARSVWVVYEYTTLRSRHHS
jgi:hypothetical protein